MRIYLILLGAITSGQRLDLCQRKFSEGRFSDVICDRLQYLYFKPIIFVIEVDRPSWSSSVNTTEIEICIQNSKMGVLSDEKGPNSNDYTACAIGLELPDICDNDNCQLPKDAYCPGNQWFSNPVPVQSRIFNGEPAIRDSWPWIVSLSEIGSSSSK